MKFPRIIRRKKAEVRIYGKQPNYPRYRVAWDVNGQRRRKAAGLPATALSIAEQMPEEFATRSQTPALAAKQALDALPPRACAVVLLSSSVPNRPC